eukprot:103469_1
MNEKAVFSAHRTQLQNGENNDQHTIELINILGGIDNVLTKILELNIPPDKQFELSPLQLKSIYNIINSKSQISSNQMNKIQQKITNAEDYDTLYYELDSNDTLLHSIMEHRNAQAIINIMHHTIIYIIIILSAIIWSILATPFFTSLIYPFYIIAMSIILWIPYSIMMLCMMNRKAAKMITTNFEFWLKSIYGFVYFIATFVDLYGLHFDELDEYNGSIIDYVIESDIAIRLQMTADILFLAIVIPLLIMIISFWDAFYGIRYWKIGLSAFLALQFTLFSIWLQFMSYTRDDIYHVQIHGLGFPMLSLRITSLKILAIFLWKHSFLALIRKKKSISIKIHPHLIWKSGNVNENKNITDMDNINVHKQQSIDSEMNIPAINPNHINKTPAVRMKSNISYIDDNKSDH